MKMKKITSILLILAMALMLCGCCLKHDYAPATCTEPETCTKCGKTQGTSLGHTWVEATCTEPKTCSVCGETEGSAIADEVAFTAGSREFTVAEANYNFMNQFITFYQNYGSYAAYIGLDLTNGIEGLAEQECPYTDGGTWYDYFCEQTVETVKCTQAVIDYAAENGIELTEEDKNSIVEYFDAYAESITEYGYEDFDEYLVENYGEGVTKDIVVANAVDSYLAQYAYSVKASEFMESVSAEEAAAAYPYVSVRHILIAAEADENGEFSEKALKKAENRANFVLKLWQSGEATEESFAQLAADYSDDPGSNGNGGLYEDVYPGQTVEEFDAFCFDEARQAGDTAVVYGSNGAYAGYHVMYFVGHDDDASVESYVEELLYNWFEEICNNESLEETEFMQYVGQF